MMNHKGSVTRSYCHVRRRAQTSPDEMELEEEMYALSIGPGRKRGRPQPCIYLNRMGGPGSGHDAMLLTSDDHRVG